MFPPSTHEVQRLTLGILFFYQFFVTSWSINSSILMPYKSAIRSITSIDGICLGLTFAIGACGLFNDTTSSNSQTGNSESINDSGNSSENSSDTTDNSSDDSSNDSSGDSSEDSSNDSSSDSSEDSSSDSSSDSSDDILFYI